ncbi:CDGSH iron-sulfur domain-containing protein [Candidatus Woesearchaeota archaeon]|nr:CDGSH iron-sulfur domain-containing protein [Candidatus Woesearchaeota archaeon]
MEAQKDSKAELPETAVEINAEAGKKYSFCTCGQSKKLPYCDNSHKQYNIDTGSHYRSFKVFPKQSARMHVSSSNWEKEG